MLNRDLDVAPLCAKSSIAHMDEDEPCNNVVCVHVKDASRVACLPIPSNSRSFLPSLLCGLQTLLPRRLKLSTPTSPLCQPSIFLPRTHIQARWHHTPRMSRRLRDSVRTGRCSTRTTYMSPKTCVSAPVWTPWPTSRVCMRAPMSWRLTTCCGVIMSAPVRAAKRRKASVWRTRHVEQFRLPGIGVLTSLGPRLRSTQRPPSS